MLFKKVLKYCLFLTYRKEMLFAELLKEAFPIDFGTRCKVNLCQSILVNVYMNVYGQKS